MTNRELIETLKICNKLRIKESKQDYYDKIINSDISIEYFIRMLLKTNRIELLNKSASDLCNLITVIDEVGLKEYNNIITEITDSMYYYIKYVGKHNNLDGRFSMRLKLTINRVISAINHNKNVHSAILNNKIYDVVVEQKIRINNEELSIKEHGYQYVIYHKDLGLIDDRVEVVLIKNDTIRVFKESDNINKIDSKQYEVALICTKVKDKSKKIREMLIRNG